MNWRRECSLPSSIRSTMPSMSSCCMFSWLLSLDDERVGGIPGERHVAARADGTGAVAVPIRCDDGQLAPRPGLDQVLDRDAKVARDCYAAMNDIATGSRGLGTGAVCRDL